MGTLGTTEKFLKSYYTQIAETELEPIVAQVTGS